MSQRDAPSFSVISGARVHEALHGREEQVTRIVEKAYLLHGSGQTVNPDSRFLTFADQPSARIIALPASVRGDVDVHGIKWISSFPENVAHGIPRASAVLVLNDTRTGYPFTCMEGSIVSAARTAASAALAAVTLGGPRWAGRPVRIGFLGVGLIARYVHTYLVANGLRFGELGIHDLSAEHAEGFRGYLRRTERGAITVHDKAEQLIRAADLVVFATTAGQPHVTDPAWFRHNPVVLHISLRDLAPDVILSSFNVADDVEHCMKAGTSLHRTESLVGNREFVAGTLYDVLRGIVTCPLDRPVVFSPFGLGVLDLAVARYVYDQVAAAGQLLDVPAFFAEMSRYG